MKRTLSTVTAALLLSSLPALAGESADKHYTVNVTTGNKNTQITISGGVSGAYLYANNPGEGESNNRKSKFILTNALFDLDIAPKDTPVPFDLDVGLGGTTTPSLVDSPKDDWDSSPGWDVEYADFSITPVQNLTLEAGLLQPNAGYEDTYTFNNKNITVGLIASQQPYNAFGGRATYSLNGFDFYFGYYRDRLAEKQGDEEYDIDGYSDDEHSYELGVSGNVAGFDTTVYFYNVNRIRRLTGVAVERDFDNLYVAFDADYWQWGDDAKRFQNIDDKSAYGVSLYISPRITKQIEIPVRLEYANQGSSELYIDSPDADNIYAVTVTPTYHLTDNIYIRAEAAYIQADNAFQNNDGDVKDSRYYLGTEVGYAF